MDQRRKTLHQKLMTAPGVNDVYFQPPGDYCMMYPCIRYKREDAFLHKADNKTYRFTQRYTLTVITRDPDSPTAKWLVENFPMCSIDRAYTADNLYHTVLTLYN